jgi:ribosome modulation factor
MSDTTITRIPLDAKARREGYLAGRRGLSGEVNPYQPGTREALAWQIGLVDGRTKRLRIVDSDRGV